MINWKVYLIDIDLLTNNKENFLRFSNYVNEDVIKILWANHKNDTEYHKMSDHMAKRFKTFFSDPALLYSGTPCIQNFLNYNGMLNVDSVDAFKSTEFFKFIRCHYGGYKIKEMFGNELLDKWTNLKSINFFFELNIEQQTLLVNDYNSIYDKLIKNI